MRKNTVFGGVLALIVGFAILGPAWADADLAKEFESAMNGDADPNNSYSFAIEGCTFRREHVRFFGCRAKSELGEAAQIIRTTIDLTEIHVITAREIEGHFMLRFEAQAPRPGPLWIWRTDWQTAARGRLNAISRQTRPCGRASS